MKWHKTREERLTKHNWEYNPVLFLCVARSIKTALTDQIIKIIKLLFVLNGYCLPPLKNPPSLNSFNPNSSGPTPTRDTPLALRSGSSLLISDAIHRHTWQPNLRRKNKTTGWSCHRDWSSTLWNTHYSFLVTKNKIIKTFLYNFLLTVV